STKDGSDLLDRTPDIVKDSQHSAVTFYSTNSVWMEGLRLPAGMYKLIGSTDLFVCFRPGHGQEANMREP
ncbi:MAG TPA: hypothetical protein VFE27_21895, partial [Acidobacteriaceae bacterium]|nr:hypothetical protein [Acidobacteriaceae bacterium]